jgi:hypothetical protein
MSSLFHGDSADRNGIDRLHPCCFMSVIVWCKKKVHSILSYQHVGVVFWVHCSKVATRNAVLVVVRIPVLLLQPGSHKSRLETEHHHFYALCSQPSRRFRTERGFLLKESSKKNTRQSVWIFGRKYRLAFWIFSHNIRNMKQIELDFLADEKHQSPYG